MSLQGVNCIAFSPLGHSDPGVINNGVLQEVAQELGRTPAQVRRQCLLMSHSLCPLYSLIPHPELMFACKQGQSLWLHVMHSKLCWSCLIRWQLSDVEALLRPDCALTVPNCGIHLCCSQTCKLLQALAGLHCACLLYFC